MAFIEPMHRNKPNITYLLLLQHSLLWCDITYNMVLTNAQQKSDSELRKKTTFTLGWVMECLVLGKKRLL